MIATRRLLAVLAGGAALASGLLVAPAAAQADAPTLAVTGSAAAPAGTVRDAALTFDITVSGAALDAATFTATSPASAPVRAGTVTVDGTVAPSATVTSAGQQTIVRLGTGATALTGGRLDVGKHVVTWRAAAKDVQAGDQVTATVAGTSGLLPVTADAAPVAVPTADLALTVPAHSGEDQVLPLGTGQLGAFIVGLTNNGTAVSRGTLTVQLPAHLVVDPDSVFSVDDSDDPDCSVYRHSLTCALGAVGAGANRALLVGLQSVDGAPVGQVERFTITAAPTSGAEATPANDSVSGAVRYAGAAHLSLELRPARTRTASGDADTVQVVVHNDGPQAAPFALGFIAVVDRLDSDTPRSKHFRITHFTGATIDPSDVDLGDLGSGSASAPVIVGLRTAALHRAMSRLQHTVRPAADRDLPPLLWNIGSVAAGRTHTETVTLKASAPGQAYLVGLAFAPNDEGMRRCASLLDGDAPPPHDRCPFVDSVRLTATAAHAGSDGSGSRVADTGAPTGQLTILGLLAVAAGALLMRVTAVTRRGRHHR